MSNPEHPENFNIEDEFIVGSDKWIHLPGGQGKIAPDGTVFDQNGEPMYSLYEDSEAPLVIYLDDEDDYEWVNDA